MGSDHVVYADQLRKWSTGVNWEVNWWAGFFDTRGRDFPGGLEAGLLPDLAWDVHDLPSPKPADKVLDVGSGPLTAVARVVDGKRLDLTAVDPLAPYYARVLAAADLRPPVPSQQAFAEDLTASFDPETFDFVNMMNALDHSIDPLRAIEEMLIVTKVGGTIVLSHTIDEAERSHHEGLHQWNFNIENGKFLIWGKDGRHVIDDIFRDVASMTTRRGGHGPNSLRTVIKKMKPMAISINDRRQSRLQEVLSASLDVVYKMHAELSGEGHHRLATKQKPKRWRLRSPFVRE